MPNHINIKMFQIRKNNGLTQEEFGKILNMQRSTYAYKEVKGDFTAEDVLTIIEHFNLAADFFEDKNEHHIINFENIENDENVQIYRSVGYNFDKTDDEAPTIITYKESKLLKRFRTLSEDEKQRLLDFLENLQNE